MPLDDPPPGQSKPVEGILAKLACMGEEERAGAVLTLAETLAERVGLDWDSLLAAHQRRVGTRKLPDTDWEPLPPTDDTFGPTSAGYGGAWRRYKGRIAAVRERGPGAGVAGGWYLMIDGIPVIDGRPIYPGEAGAMEAAERYIEVYTEQAE